MKKQLNFLRRRVALAAAGVLALAACGGTVAGAANIMGIKSYRAEDFFTGQKLEIAHAMQGGDMARVRQLAAGVDLATPGQRGMTLLIFAMTPGTPGYPNYEAVKMLVSLGVNPDTQIIEGMGSALFTTFIERKDPNDQTGVLFFKAMLDGGMSPNLKDSDGTQLLHRAAGDGQLAHVKMLVERGAEVNFKSKYVQDTALDEAVDTLKPSIGIYLVQHGAAVNTHLTNGSSTAYAVSLRLKRLRPEDPRYKQYEQLRDLMIAKGAKWPPDPPEVVREQMRAQGLKPAVPPGHKR